MRGSDHRPLRHLATAAAATALAAAASACVEVRPHTAGPDTPAPPEPTVLLMPLDVIVLELGTAGLALPQPEWTDHARRALAKAAEAEIADHDARLVRYRGEEEAVVPYDEAHLPAVRLHRIVRRTIMSFRYGSGADADLPLAGADATWSLGAAVRPLARDYDADYALFLAYRQATSTGGRALLTLTGFFLFGVIQPTSQSLGFATLVSLDSGEVVWTNLLQASALDVSRPDGLRQRGRELLAELPL